MSFISAGFFMAMALTACLYYLIPKKYQWELLLFVSFGFYATYGIRYMGYILFTIITSYCITRLMAAQKEKLMRRRWLIFGLVSNFGILVFLVCQFYNTESDFIVFGISSGISAWKAFNCDAAWNFFLYIPDNELRDRCLSEKI